jgi:hypothetical protein
LSSRGWSRGKTRGGYRVMKLIKYKRGGGDYAVLTSPERHFFIFMKSLHGNFFRLLPHLLLLLQPHPCLFHPPNSLLFLLDQPQAQLSDFGFVSCTKTKFPCKMGRFKWDFFKKKIPCGTRGQNQKPRAKTAHYLLLTLEEEEEEEEEGRRRSLLCRRFSSPGIARSRAGL